MALYNQEFRAWLIEEKMVNRETLSKEQEKKLFLQFVEDYNTGERWYFFVDILSKIALCF